MPPADRFTQLEIRVDELVGAVNGLRERLDAHIGNHHSRASTIRQGSAVGAALSLAWIAVELLRRFVL